MFYKDVSKWFAAKVLKQLAERAEVYKTKFFPFKSDRWSVRVVKGVTEFTNREIMVVGIDDGVSPTFVIIVNDEMMTSDAFWHLVFGNRTSHARFQSYPSAWFLKEEELLRLVNWELVADNRSGNPEKPIDEIEDELDGFMGGIISEWDDFLEEIRQQLKPVERYLIDRYPELEYEIHNTWCGFQPEDGAMPYESFTSEFITEAGIHIVHKVYADFRCANGGDPC